MIFTIPEALKIIDVVINGVVGSPKEVSREESSGGDEIINKFTFCLISHMTT